MIFRSHPLHNSHSGIEEHQCLKIIHLEEIAYLYSSHAWVVGRLVRTLDWTQQPRTDFQKHPCLFFYFVLVKTRQQTPNKVAYTKLHPHQTETELVSALPEMES